MQHGAFLDIDPELELGFDVIPGLCEGGGQSAHEGTDENEDENGARDDEGEGGAEQAREELLSEVHGGERCELRWNRASKLG